MQIRLSNSDRSAGVSVTRYFFAIATSVSIAASMPADRVAELTRQRKCDSLLADNTVGQKRLTPTWPPLLDDLEKPLPVDAKGCVVWAGVYAVRFAATAQVTVYGFQLCLGVRVPVRENGGR